MNTRAVLITPWRSGNRPLRWLSIGVWLLCTVAGSVIALLTHSPQRLWIAVSLYAGGLGYLWAFYLASMILLAVDAGQLSLPGMRRAVLQAMLVYALLCIVPATLVFGAFGGPVLPIALLLTLCVVGALCLALLPRYFAVATGLLPGFSHSLGVSAEIPGPNDPRFLIWAPVVVLALLAICANRWSALMRSNALGNSFTDAMVLAYRTNAWGRAWGDASNATKRVRQQPTWLQTRADLSHTGPQQASTSLRVALGGMYLPKSLSGHLRSALNLLLVILLPGLVVWLNIARQGGLSVEFYRIMLMMALAWGGLWGGMGLLVISSQLITQRWQRVNTELPLLALMPGLGEPAQLKRRLLRVSLQRPLLAQALMLAVLLALAVHTHASTNLYALIFISQLGCAAALVACLLCALGGRPVLGWRFTLLMSGIGVLLGLMSFVPTSLAGNPSWMPGQGYINALLIGWLLIGSVLAWLGLRGWTSWQRRPHAFIANA